MCRHTVGLNYTAIGIEHVGSSDAQILRQPRQMAASLRLTRWLRCRYGIGVNNVIGHGESLCSPYHRSASSGCETQTHGDMDHAAMQTYRAKLGANGHLLSTLGTCEIRRRAVLSILALVAADAADAAPRPSPG